MSDYPGYPSQDDFFLSVFLHDLVPHQDLAKTPYEAIRDSRTVVVWFSQNDPENNIIEAVDVPAFLRWLDNERSALASMLDGHTWSKKHERRKSRKRSTVKAVLAKYGYMGIARDFVKGNRDAKAVVARMSKTQKTTLHHAVINYVAKGILAERKWALAYYKKMSVDDIKLMDQAFHEGGLKTNSRRRKKHQKGRRR